MGIKKTLTLFVAVIALVITASCNKSSPETVADKFLTSFYEMDYTEAKKYATDNTQSVLTTIENLKDKFLQSAQGELKTIKVKIVDVKEDGDKATITYNVSDGEGIASKTVSGKKLYMVKEKGEWKVNFTKDNNMDDIDAAIGGDVEDGQQ